MPKVLFISNHAGFSKFNAPFMLYLREKNYEVHNASPGIEYACCDKQIDIPIQRNPVSIKNIQAYKILKKACILEKYDIIHCHTPTGGLIGRLLGRYLKRKNVSVKIIYTAHGFHFYKGSPLLNWLLYYPVERYLSLFTDYIITINEEDYKLAKHRFNNAKIFKINSVGIDLNRYRSIDQNLLLEYRNLYNLNENEFVVIYIAQFIKRKNHKMLFDVIPYLNSRIRNIKYIFIGDGPLLIKYKNLCKKKNINNIIFTGYITRVPEICSLGSIHVTTSKQEGFSLNNLEAMACGLPVIATNIRGHRDAIEDLKNGFLINNKKELIEYITFLYEKPEIRLKISNYNKKYVEKYSIEKILPIMGKVYDEAISNK
jgi:glycosyltransferase EpsD